MADESVWDDSCGDEQSSARDDEANSPTAGSPETASSQRRHHLQALLDLRGAGSHLANGEDPDDYVRRLREGWD
jgi:hypothetical protein